MSNTVLNASMIAREALMQFKNGLGFTKGVNRQYDDQFKNKGAKIGNTINIRLPHNFEVSDGAALQLQNTTDRTVSLTLNQRKHVAFQFSTEELSLNIEDFSNRYITPAAHSLANKVDITGLAKAKSIFNSVGTPGTAPTSMETYLSAAEKLNNFSCPEKGRTMLINPRASTKIVNALLALQNPAGRISDQFDEGVMSRAAGFDWRMSQNISRHTVGALGGTPLVDGASQSGASILTKGWTAAAANRLKEGDVVTFAGVYQVNPVTLEATENLMQFTLTADFASDGSGNGSIAVSPALVLEGPYKNVSGAPANEAVIQIFGHASSYAGLVTSNNLAYHKDAFILGCADLYMPKGIDMGAVAQDEASGLSVRFIRFYDGKTDEMISRLDVLFGWLAARPEWACRVQG